ncbi:unnamed protein product [Polarella glacialis]|uniref:Methyltransferase type 11 domain-containing protein n=1 Tax=Polarella glacialis TaxID=89957 RepID=A0A813IDK4_POLGL|nr:unnamed protein product [Polarella glacialis]CAE8648821.1 unnamed protein product [Polarella glacialis]
MVPLKLWALVALSTSGRYLQAEGFAVEYYLGQFLNMHLNSSANLSILEVGSMERDVGYPRRMAHPRWSWFGVDIQQAPGVDLVLEDPYSLPFADRSFDAVVCTEVLEHADFFWLTFQELSRVSNSLVFVISPSRGPYHDFPRDSWRWRADAPSSMARWAQRVGIPIVVRESFILLDDPTHPWDWDKWGHMVAVFERGDFGKDGLAAQPKKPLLQNGFSAEYVFDYNPRCWGSRQFAGMKGDILEMIRKCCLTGHSESCWQKEFGWEMLECCAPSPASMMRNTLDKRVPLPVAMLDLQ